MATPALSNVKVGLVSLGCAKNLVDSEQMLGLLQDAKMEIVASPSDADVIIINTCAFIEEAKQESIATILEMAKYHKKLIVMGCLSERYQAELTIELPEVDLFLPIRDYPSLPQRINELFGQEVLKEPFSYRHRLLTTPPFTAYLKISDGCDNRCTYCAIPLIRGSFKSRPFAEIIDEAHLLDAKGVQELVVISQDTTRYGSDLEPRSSIIELLQALLAIPAFKYIRLLYLYPDEVDDELLHLIAKEPRLTQYFDLPIQHASDRILSAMHRRGNQAFLRDLFQNRVRKILPKATLRTTLIVGFPGETEEDFAELLDFVEEIKFDHLGAFMYSSEEDTVAATLLPAIPQAVKEERYQRLMRRQRVIAYQLNKERIGEVMEGLVIKYDSRLDLYHLRSGWNAPDGIDGEIHFTSPHPLTLGEQVKVKITTCYGYDLEGELSEE